MALIVTVAGSYHITFPQACSILNAGHKLKKGGEMLENNRPLQNGRPGNW